jgi:CheY-like chemotaxis protein
VLLNLVLNARDAMPQGGRLELVVDSMVLEAERIEGDHRIAPGGFVRVAVRDTGCGMDEATMRRVFEPFFTTKDPGKGTGLGLASAYGILVQHNGWIEVSSRVGEGSEFRVHLPLARSRAMPAQSPGQPAVSGGRESILFVEIDDHLRWVVTKSLERLGYRVITAVDPLGAMQQWEACDGAVDLLLASMMMPGGLTGLDLAEKLRAVRPELRVILSIGHASEIHSLSYRRPETIEYLSKPYSIDALSKAVRRCLDRA